MPVDEESIRSDNDDNRDLCPKFIDIVCRSDGGVVRDIQRNKTDAGYQEQEQSRPHEVGYGVENLKFVFVNFSVFCKLEYEVIGNGCGSRAEHSADNVQDDECDTQVHGYKYSTCYDAGMNTIEPKEMEQLFLFAHDAHTNFNVRDQRHVIRRGLYPYMVHSLWAANTLVMDPDLPEHERVLGFKILVLHDVLEDTSKQLPEWVEQEVQDGVRMLTHDTWEEEKEAVRSYTPFFKLLKLVDKMQTMYERGIERPQKQAEWKELMEALLTDVIAHYGKTRVTVMARALLDDTSW